MKTIKFYLSLMLLFAAITIYSAPNRIGFQGNVRVGNANFDGNGQFKFMIYNNSNTVLWTNDGSSPADITTAPTNAVTIAVSAGFYAVDLGDSAIANMTAIPASVFTADTTYLRIWFNDGATGFELLQPDSLINSAPYALSPDNHSLDAADGNPVDAVFVNNTGNVGIGTTNPGTTLEVAGTIKASSFVDATGTPITGPAYAQISTSLGTPAEVQAFATSGATDCEPFTIGADQYLAVSNNYNGSSYNTNSKIYKWMNSEFVEFQSIATSGALDWEAFTIAGDTYLAVANGFDVSYNTNSKIYKFVDNAFVEIQSIPTNNPYDWESFTIGTDQYLVVANDYNGSVYTINSKIYKWVDTAFVEFQSIATNGAYDWEAFMIGADHYLAVANHFNNSSYNIDSKIYRWNGTEFTEVQAIPTNGAIEWESFTIGDDTYLAVANHYNGSYNLNSKIYRWNGTSFVEIQSIATNGAIDWEAFTIGNETYLAVANHLNGSTYILNSKIYQWSGSAFIEIQSIAASGASSMSPFTIAGVNYLAVANYYNGSYNLNSKIYRLGFLLTNINTSVNFVPANPVNFSDDAVPKWSPADEEFVSSNISEVNGNVGIGTTNPSETLEVAGNIKVTGGGFIDDGQTLNVPDYVFGENHKLMPLEELSAFINEKKHLPNIPSAADIQENGVNLSTFQMLLLEKIEELTLHTLEQQKQIERLRSEMQELKVKENF